MADKIRVLHISKRYPPYIGGIETLCSDIAHALDGTGKYEQIVLAYNDSKETIKENYEGINVVRVGVQKTIASQPLAKDYGIEMKRIFDEFKPDIVHFYYPNPFAAHYFLKQKFKGKLILHWICDIIKQKFLKKFFYRQNLKLLKRADLVLTITPTYYKDTDYLPNYKGPKDVLACCIGKERTHITDEQKTFAEEIKKKYKGKKICFFFGRHVEYKGLTYLIESDRYLDRDKVQIIIAGEGPLTEELKKQASEFDNIEFVGRLSEDDINSYLMACDIFTFPSITRNEAFGISLAEAMYFGKPCCTFTIPGSGVNWVSIDGETGLEAPNRDVRQFAINIMKLVDSLELYSRLSGGAKNRCEQLFSIDQFNRNTVNIYLKKGENIGK